MGIDHANSVIAARGLGDALATRTTACFPALTLKRLIKYFALSD